MRFPPRHTSPVDKHVVMERVLLDGFDVEVSSAEQDSDKGKDSNEELLLVSFVVLIVYSFLFYFRHGFMQLIHYIKHRCKDHKREIE